jgi:hypothetical protein
MAPSSVEIEQIASVKELGELLHVNRTTVNNWAARRQVTGFPAPFKKVANSPLWRKVEVAYWWTYWHPIRNIPKVGYLDPEWQDVVAQLPRPNEQEN